MPTFHFDIHHDEGIVIDDEGIDAADLDAAGTMALEVLGQAILDDARRRKTGAVKIEVRDATGRVILKASAMVSLDRLVP